MHLIELKLLYSVPLSNYIKLTQEMIFSVFVISEAFLQGFLVHEDITSARSTLEGRSIYCFSDILLISLQLRQHWCHILLIKLHTVLNESQFSHLSHIYSRFDFGCLLFLKEFKLF